MKILHFLWALDNGGAENLAVDLANEQSREHDVIILVGNDRIDETVRSRILPAVRLVPLGRPASSRNPYWIVRVLFSLRTLHPDVVHAHADNLAKLGNFIAAPLILTLHATHIQLEPSAKRFAVACCISATVLRDVSSRYPSLKVRQVNNGVLTQEIATGVPQPSAQLRGVQVSRLRHEIKGQDILIRALALVNAAPNQPKLTIDFIGDGPSMAHLVSVANEYGVSEYCHFAGAMSRNDIYQTLWQYDLLVQPSRYEGFGLTVAEGMASGVAVVVSDVEGPMEIINGGEFGQHFKSNDVASLAAALQKTMASLHTPAGVAQRAAAQKHALEKYDLRQTAAHYCKIYREVVNA